MSREALERITALEKALKIDATLPEAEHWWSMALAIEQEITRYRTLSDTEQQKMRQVKEGISGAIRMIREQYPSPDMGIPMIALTGLRIELERTTTGFDGLPLRHN